MNNGYWLIFFKLLDKLSKSKYESVLLVCDTVSELCLNRHFWTITHKKQFNYIEMLAFQKNTERFWSVETPIIAVDDLGLNRSIIHMPSMVVFALATQLSQFLSFAKTFDRLCIPMVLVCCGSKIDFRLFLYNFSFYYVLECTFLSPQIFVSYVKKFLQFKKLFLSEQNIELYNKQFFDKASFFTILNRWSSVISGIQFVKRKKRRLFVSRNKYNVRLLNRA